MSGGTEAGPVLALDTSARACGVCLWQAGQVLARLDRPMDHGHAEALAPQVRAVLTEAGRGVQALAAIAVTVGPGSFTGLRVGLAFARGLALAAGCPVWGATTTAVVARMARADAQAPGRPLMVVLDARRAEVYRQAFDADGRPLAPVAAIPPESLVADLSQSDWLVAGDGVPLLTHPLPAGVAVSPRAGQPPDPAVLADLVAEHPDERLAPRPLYIRPPDAALPAPSARARAPA